VSDQLSLSQKP